MIKLEDTPWFICNPEDKNYCVYVDTDSNYYHAEPLLRHLYPRFDSMAETEKEDALAFIAGSYEKLITQYYNTLAKEAFNILGKHEFEMKTECIIRSGYFRAPRRYAQWITRKEGVSKDDLDIKGLEFKKANFPKIFGDFFDDILQRALKGAEQKEIDQLINDFRSYILSDQVDITLLGNPTSVKTLNGYIHDKPPTGNIFSILKSEHQREEKLKGKHLLEDGKTKKKIDGVPAPVKAAIRYNDLLTFWKLDKQHSKIVQGDKIKWIYLKDNPYKIEALAFLDFDMPEKIRILLNQYADKSKSFETILESKLQGFYSDLGWELNLNPYRNLFFI